MKQLEITASHVQLRKTTLVILDEAHETPGGHPITLTLFASDIAQILGFADLAEAAYLYDADEIAHLMQKNRRAIIEALLDVPFIVTESTSLVEYNDPRQDPETKVLVTHYERTEFKLVKGKMPTVFDFVPWQAAKKTVSEQAASTAAATLALAKVEAHAKLAKLRQDKELMAVTKEIEELEAEAAKAEVVAV